MTPPLPRAALVAMTSHLARPGLSFAMFQLVKWGGISALFIFALAGCEGGKTMKRSARAVEPEQREVAVRELRIVTIGDSLAAGTGDESDGGFAGRIKHHLRAQGVESIETVNLGVNGAQTADVLQRLRSDRTRSAVKSADVVILSIGANDLFRTPGAREQTLRAPFRVAEDILERIVGVVGEIERINPEARILILGAYNPVPRHALAPMLNRYLEIWDETLTERFAKNPNVTVVLMSDIVTPQRLSRYDSFHPGGAAYEEASKRIASILTVFPKSH